MYFCYPFCSTFVWKGAWRKKQNFLERKVQRAFIGKDLCFLQLAAAEKFDIKTSNFTAIAEPNKRYQTQDLYGFCHVKNLKKTLKLQYQLKITCRHSKFEVVCVSEIQ